MFPNLTHMAPITVDLGFEILLQPESNDVVPLLAQHLFRGDHLFFEAQSGVTLESIRVGNRGQASVQGPVPIVFYSVPTNAKALDKIWKLIADDPCVDLATVQAESDDPEAVLGLPVRLDTAEVGNQISLFLKNHSSEPVRVRGVLRGRAAM